MMEDIAGAQWLRRLIVALSLAGLIFLAFGILQPFIVPMLWAVILAYVTWPLYDWFLRLVGGRSGIAAGIMTVILSAGIILPLVYILILLEAEVMPVYRELYPRLVSLSKSESLQRLPVIGIQVHSLVSNFASDPSALDYTIQELIKKFSSQIGFFIGSVGRNIIKILIAMISLFFMYRDGERLASQVEKMLQQFFGEVRVKTYMYAIGSTVKAVVYGLFLAALAQGVLAGIGYWAAGLRAPALLGSLTFLVGLIPFAVPFMWGGASLWLFLTGKTVAALGLCLWGLTAVSWIDNIVRPLVISGATRVHFLLVMFGVLGGLSAFGLVGLFIGPVVLAVLMAIWREWVAEKRLKII